jgi:hypothetical protein
MNYVLAIMVIALLAWPLRSVMRSEDDPFGGGHTLCGISDRLLALLLYATLFVGTTVAYIAGVRPRPRRV